MLLAIDVGNTHTVIGLFRGDELVDHWRIHTSAERTADELALVVGDLVSFQDVDLDGDVTGVAIASGVPRLTASLRDMAQRYVGVEPLVLGPGVKTGMPIKYEDASAVGPDRIADALAAFEIYGGPAVVVDFGTATVFDGISAEGEYLGGSIVPGIEISLDALYQRSSLLRRAELVEPPSVIGRNTVQSIQSGVLFGFAALVDGLVDRYEEELGECHVVATGGLCGLIAPISRTIAHVDPWLTLHGLRLIHAKNLD